MARDFDFKKVGKNAREIASQISNLTLLIDRIPDKIGGWVNPLKKFYHENKKVISAIGVVDKTTKAAAGKLKLWEAGILAVKLRGTGLSRTMSTLGAVSAYATSKMVGGSNKARTAAARHAAQLQKVAKEQQKIQKQAAAKSPTVAKGAVGSSRSGISFGGAAIGAAALGLGAKATGAVTGALSKGDALARQSEISGLPIRSLAFFRDTADDLGISMDSVSKGTLIMQRNLKQVEQHGGLAAVALRDLGLAGSDIIKMAPEDQFMAIADAITAVQDPAERISATMKIFGKNSAELIPLFNELQHLDPNDLGKYATALAETAAGFRETAIAARIAKDNMSTFAIGLANGLKPLFDMVNDMGTSGELKALGEAFAGTIVTVIDSLRRFWAFTGHKPFVPLAKVAEEKEKKKAEEKAKAAKPKSIFDHSGLAGPTMATNFSSSLRSFGRPTSFSKVGIPRFRSTLDMHVPEGQGTNRLAASAPKSGIDLLPLHERRSIASINAVQTGERSAAAPSAFNTVKRGDRARSKAYAQEQVRQQNGIDKLVQQNQDILDQLKEWNQ